MRHEQRVHGCDWHVDIGLDVHLRCWYATMCMTPDCDVKLMQLRR
jgi:hypothetical protein